MVIDLTQILNTQPAQNASLNNALAQPQNTFMQDLSAGYKDNYNTPIALNNFAPDANKTWANRIGEGLGTVGRIIDSPAGRMALAGGLTAMLGGSNTDIAKEALGAYVGRQQTQTADKAYRNQLQSLGIDTSGISGDINGEVYKNVTNNLYRTKKLSSDDAIRQMNWVRQAQMNNQIDEATAKQMMSQIQSNMDLSNINFQDSNMTTRTGIMGDLADSRIKVDEARIKAIDASIAQNAQKIAQAQQRIAQGDRSLALKQELQNLTKIYKELQIQKLQAELGEDNDIIPASNSAKTNGYSTTKSGTKYRVK